MSVPNVLRYRDIGYVDAHNDAVQYLSTNGRTKVRAEVQRLFGNDGEVARDRKYRMRVECDDGTWVTVHSGTTAKGDKRLTEMTVGLSDGTVVAVTGVHEPEFRFDVTGRTADGRLVDDRALTEMSRLKRRGTVATVTLQAEGTRIVVEYANPEVLVCEAFVSDGTRVRMLTRPTIQYFRRDRPPGVATHAAAVDAKYLVCRRDLSGYEFVDDGVEPFGRPSSSRCIVQSSDDQVTVVRTLTRSHFDGRTAGLLDDALSVHLKSVGKLAHQLNDSFPDTAAGQIDRPRPLVTDT